MHTYRPLGSTDEIMHVLPTAREGNVFTGVCNSVHKWPHGCWFTAHSCYGAVGTHPTAMLSCFTNLVGKNDGKLSGAHRNWVRLLRSLKRENTRTLHVSMVELRGALGNKYVCGPPYKDWHPLANPASTTEFSRSCKQTLMRPSSVKDKN